MSLVNVRPFTLGAATAPADPRYPAASDPMATPADTSAVLSWGYPAGGDVPAQQVVTVRRDAGDPATSYVTSDNAEPGARSLTVVGLMPSTAYRFDIVTHYTIAPDSNGFTAVEAHSALAAFTTDATVGEPAWTRAVPLPEGSGTTAPIDNTDPLLYPLDQRLAGTGAGRPYAAVWWTFTATTAHPVDLVGVRLDPPLDGWLAIWDGDPRQTSGGSNTGRIIQDGVPDTDSPASTGSNLVGWGDDNGGAGHDGQGAITFTPVPGRTYYIAVGPYPSSTPPGGPALRGAYWALSYAGVNAPG